MAPEAMETLVCKVCSCVIPREHLDDGRAIRNGAQVLCATCCRSVQISRNVSGRQQAAESATRVTTAATPSASQRTNPPRVLNAPKLPPGVTLRRPNLTRVAADSAQAPSSASARLKAPDAGSLNIGLPVSKSAAPAPASQSARRSAIQPSATISVRRKQALVCRQCHTPVSEAQIASGSALEIEGKVTCPSCLASSSRLRKRHWLIAGAAVLVLICAYFIVPQPTLFVMTLAGLGMLFCGALMFEMASTPRLGLAFGGIVLSVASFWQITTLRSSAEAAREAQELSAARDEIQALLASNQPLEAQRAVKRLRAHDAGATTAHRLADECEALIVAWLDANYADCDEVGRKLALVLTEVFPSADGKSRRISAVSASEKRIALTLAAQEDRLITFRAPELSRELTFDAGFEEAWLLANHLYSSVRSLEWLEITLVLPSGKQHLLRVSAADYESLKSAAKPASVLANSK